MTSLEAIGNSQQAAAPRANETPVVRVQEPESEQAVDRQERVARGARTHRVELPARSFQARLNYDRAAEEVVVEILNPETGDVLQRIPAEKLPDDLLAKVSRGDPLLEQLA